MICVRFAFTAFLNVLSVPYIQVFVCATYVMFNYLLDNVIPGHIPIFPVFHAFVHVMLKIWEKCPGNVPGNVTMSRLSMQ